MHVKGRSRKVALNGCSILTYIKTVPCPRRLCAGICVHERVCWACVCPSVNAPVCMHLYP